MAKKHHFWDCLLDNTTPPFTYERGGGANERRFLSEWQTPIGAGIQRDKTMADKMMYIPNDDRQNYTF